MTILVVEDSKLLSLAATRALTKAGYQVTTAVDGEEALRITQETLPDLVLLDMILPKVTGLDVLRRLKKNPRTRDIPVIVMSGLSQANRQRLVKEGAAAFLEKSQRILDDGSSELIETVKRVFASASK